MQYLPFLIFVLVIVGLVALLKRVRRRQAAGQVEQADRIEVGTDVMTTSGLYGTVVAKHDDGTVALSIAPGLEVRWELAALRDAESLPPDIGGGLRAAHHDVDSDAHRDTHSDAGDAQSAYDLPADGAADRP